MGPGWMLAFNLALVLMAALYVGVSDRAEKDQRLLRIVETTHGTLETQVDLMIALLLGGLGLFEASREVEPQEFRAYVRPLGLRERYPSILGLGYARPIQPFEQEEVVDSAVITYLEPRDRGNQAAIGFRLASEPARREAMERARDEGREVASTLVTLLQEQGGAGRGFLIFLPHYRAGAPRSTVEERRAALVGFVYAPLRVRELFGGALLDNPDLAVRVYAGAHPRAAEMVYEVPSDLPWRAPFHRDLEIAGQTWTLMYQFRGARHSPWRSPALPGLLTGIVFVVMFYGFQRLQLDARRRAERDAESLRVGEQRYRFLAEAMPQTVFKADREGRVTYVNRPGEIAAGDGLGSALTLRVHPDDRDGVLASWADAVRTGADWQCSFRLDPGAGYRWRLGQAAAQRAGGHIVEWVGTLTDIDKQKQAEAGLHREAEKLEDRVAARTAELIRTNQELENFAAVASHDLQEPLRKIVAFGGRLSDALGPDIPPEAADSLERMRRSAQRLHQLIADLLAFARISRAEVRPSSVDLERLAHAVATDLLEGQPDPAHVEVGPIPLTCGDAGLLRQLLENLLSNALKFCRPGVPARVTLRSEDAGDEIAPERRGDYFRLLVEDEGIGFDPKYLDRIFQMFQRLHPSDRYEGTGIGLAICQRVVELHGGRITARVAQGHGACFVVTLPRVPAVPTPKGERPP